MHTPPQPSILTRHQRGLHALANRVPKHHEPFLSSLPADVLKARKSKFRLPDPALSVVAAWGPNRSAASFRVQLQLELLPFVLFSSDQNRRHRFELESNHDVSA